MKESVQGRKYSFMSLVSKAALQKNGGKIVFSVFLFSIILMVVMSLGMALSALTLKIGGGKLSFLSPLFMLAAIFAVIVFSYGIIIISTRLTEGSYATLGFIFTGFKKKNVLALSGIFTLIFALVVFLAGLILALIQSNSGDENFILKNLESISFFLNGENSGDAQLSSQALSSVTKIIYAVYSLLFILLFIFYIWFVFTWNFLHLAEKKNEKEGIPLPNIFVLMARSIKFVALNFFHFIGFVLKSLIFELALVLLLSVLAALIPSGNSLYAFLGMIMNFFIFIVRLRLGAKALVVLPVYFYCAQGMIQIKTKDETEEKGESQESIEEKSSDSED